jgi:hypothetical protein
MNIERYKELSEWSTIALLSYDEQEELIKLSTEILHDMIDNDALVSEALTKLRNR